MKFLAVVLLFVAFASAEPPFLDEPLEGTKLDAELLSRVRDLLVSDAVGASGRGASPKSGAGSYSAPSPSNSYGPPASNGGFNGARGSGSLSGGGDSGSFGPAPGASGQSGAIDILDPELAPLIDAFDLSPTTQRRNPQSGGFGGNRVGQVHSGSSGSGLGAGGSGGY